MLKDSWIHTRGGGVIALSITTSTCKQQHPAEHVIDFYIVIATTQKTYR